MAGGVTRFDEEQLFDRLAAAGRLDLPLSQRLASVIARFHRKAERRRDLGGAAGMRRVIDGNHTDLQRDGAGVVEASRSARLHAATLAALAARADLLDARRIHGLVRQCHGDLHLRNVCLINAEPVLFDAIEFSDELSCIDVLYDLAFLVMDLHHRGLRAHANVVLNSYLEIRRDFSGLALLPLFLSCRAAIRAKVSLAAAVVQADGEVARQLRTDAGAYLDLAERLLATPRLKPPRRRILAGQRPHVLAIGGHSGSGKSSLARRLAPRLGAAPGAIVLRSDVIRKRMLGVDSLQRLPAAGYTPAVTERVYARLAHDAEAVARAGHSAVVDAVFGEPGQRTLVEDAARRAGVQFSGIWLEVSPAVAAERGAARAPDASDATAEVLQRQVAEDPGRIGWPRVDAGLTLDAVEQLALSTLPRVAPRSRLADEHAFRRSLEKAHVGQG